MTSVVGMARRSTARMGGMASSSTGSARGRSVVVPAALTRPTSGALGRPRGRVSADGACVRSGRGGFGGRFRGGGGRRGGRGFLLLARRRVLYCLAEPAPRAPDLPSGGAALSVGGPCRVPHDSDQPDQT